MFLFVPVESWITDDLSGKDKSSVNGSALVDGGALPVDGGALAVNIGALTVGGIELKREGEDVVITLPPLLICQNKNKVKYIENVTNSIFHVIYPTAKTEFSFSLMLSTLK